MFISPTHVIINTPPGRVHKILFAYKDVERIDKVEWTCTCSKVTNIVRDQVVMVEYKAQPIPMHLKKSGEYTTTPRVTVNYTSKSGEKLIQALSFTAVVKEDRIK